MPPRSRLAFSGLSVVFLFIAAAPLFRELTRPNNIWWTPRTMLVPLAQAQDRVEVYVRGEPVAATLQGDIGLRLNNWDRLRAEHLPIMLTSAAVCGALLMLFGLQVTGRLTYRGETGPRA